MTPKIRKTLDRWGNSLGLRLPKALAENAGLREGDSVDVSFEDGAIVVRRAKPRYTLHELIAGVPPQKGNQEIDWGPDVGAERFWEDED